MSTAQDLILGAYGQSLKNQPDRIATAATELLRVVNASLKGCYAIAARINPAFFGARIPVVFGGFGWTRPQNTESVFRLELPTGNEVVVVPVDQRRAEPGKPGVYMLGRVYYSAGNALDPVNETLSFFCATRHPTIADLDTDLDASWDTDFDNLPILDIATYLAGKDGRSEEAASLATARDTWLKLFVAHVEHVNPNERRQYGTLRYSNPNSLVSLASLLLSGPAMSA